MNRLSILILAILITSHQTLSKGLDLSYVVETTVIEPVKNFSVERRYIGKITAEKFSLLSTKSSGTVEAILIKAGQRVKKDQLLVSLNNEIERSALRLAEETLELLNRELVRNRSLYKTQDVTKSQVEKLERDVLAAKVKLAEQKRQLENVEIRAPFDGEVGVPRVSLGELVQPSTVIISIIDGAFSVMVRIPASRLNEVKKGQEIRALSITSTIGAVERIIDPLTRTGFAKAMLPHCKSCILGDSAFVHISVHKKDNAILLPRNAIFYKEGKPLVVVVKTEADGSKHAKLMEVSVGEEQAGRVEIVSGLVKGDEVVVINPERLTDGAKVSVLR